MNRLTHIFALLLVGSTAFVQIPLPGVLGTPNRVIGLVLLVAWLANLPKRNMIRIPATFHVVLLLFIVWNAMSFLWTSTIDIGLDKVQRYLQAFVASIILWHVLDSRSAVADAFQAYVIGGLVAIALTISDYIYKFSMYASAGRFAAMGFDPNELGVQIAMALSPAVYLMTSKERTSRVLFGVNAVYPLAAVFALLLVGSRGAALAAIPCVFYMAARLRTLGARGFLVFGSVVVGITAVIANLDLSQAIARFMSIPTSATTDHFTGRLDVWEGGMLLFAKNPVLGIGLGGFGPAVFPIVGYNFVAHNTYLSIAAELGTIGLFLFLVLLSTVGGKIIGASRDMRWMLVTMFCSWAIGAASLSWETSPQTWLVLSLIVCASQPLEEEQTSEDEGVSPPLGGTTSNEIMYDL